MRNARADSFVSVLATIAGGWSIGLRNTVSPRGCQQLVGAKNPAATTSARWQLHARRSDAPQLAASRRTTEQPVIAPGTVCVRGDRRFGTAY
jgi:hypothetical protein